MTRAESRIWLLRQKWRFDLGRAQMQSYINPIVKTGLLVAGAVWTARGGIGATSAWIAGLPLWLGFVLGTAYLGTCWAIGYFYIDVAEWLKAESQISLKANAPMQEALTILREVRAWMRGIYSVR